MLWWLAENSVVAAVLAGMVALLCRLGQFRPAVRHALWLVVLARFVTPPLLDWPWELPSLSGVLHSEPGVFSEVVDNSESSVTAEVEIDDVGVAEPGTLEQVDRLT